MKEIQIGKAHSDTDIPLEGVTIIIDCEVVAQADYARGWEELQRNVHEAQAKELDEALISALPGGTYNRLLARMLERKAGLLIIPLGEK